MTDGLKKVEFTKSHPYTRAYSPRRLRLNNGCLSITWICAALWLILCVIVVSRSSDEGRGGAIGAMFTLSIIVLIVGAAIQAGLREFRTRGEAKWKQYHSDEAEQVKVRALIEQAESASKEPANEVTARASILFLAANPLDTTALRLDEEAREIREELERAGLRDSFQFHERGAVRPKDLSRTLIDLSPRYVHFSGHGGPSGAIFLEDEVGNSKPIPASALRAMFRASGDSIHCVLLNACYSRAQAEVLVSCVPFVIGMKDTIGDKAAIAFARGFYRGIGAGRAVPKAFEIGIAEILMHSIPDDQVPELLQR